VNTILLENNQRITYGTSQDIMTLDPMKYRWQAYIDYVKHRKENNEQCGYIRPV
jgi:hypothetical protein